MQGVAMWVDKCEQIHICACLCEIARVHAQAVVQTHTDGGKQRVACTGTFAQAWAHV